jgi:hypothetical protein
MSIVDSISEDINLTLSELMGHENLLRKTYDRLSAIWERYPNEKMAYALDDLLKTWEQLRLYRLELESYADNLGDEL